jgi:hypothetical protein
MNNYKLILLPLLIALALSGQGLADNRPPVLASLGTLEVVFGRSLQFYLRADDPDGNQVFFSAANLPANAVLYQETGFFRWTPRLDQLGDYAFEFIASDNGDPPSSTGETVTVRVVYRTVEREKKAFGLLAQEKVVAEARSLQELYPHVAQMIVDGQPAALGEKSLVVASLATIELEVASPFRVDPALMTVTVNDAPVGISDFYNVKTIGGKDNIISLMFRVDRLQFVPGTSYNLSVRAANELGGTRSAWQLVVSDDKKKTSGAIE